MALSRAQTYFKPDELATTFVSLNREWRVDGLFRSSEIVLDADTTMEKMRGIVERLRLREGYTGAIHLTFIPGASDDLVERAVELADRVRLNLEAPNQAEQPASAGECQRRSLNEASCSILCVTRGQQVRMKVA